MLDSILDTIGNTHLVQLPVLSSTSRKINVYGKIEYFNPGFSIKDRAALKMIESLEKTHDIKPGDTIVESTSGNTGHALAMICAKKGYNLVCIVDPKTPKQNILIYKAFGANVLVVEEMDENGSYQKVRIKTAKELSKKNGWINLDQYSNPGCWMANYEHTGKEIYQDLNGKIDVLVACVSTGGHLSGIAKFLIEHLTKKPLIVAVEPVGSVIFGGKPKPFKINGAGLSFVPKNYFSEYVDMELKCSDHNAFSMCRYIAKHEGILLGGSSGSVLSVISSLINKGGIVEGSNVVGVLPDSGLKYIDTIYNDGTYDD
ncbi:cysteine synthase family protein [Endozoicomonas sp. SM1973]|uniref:cysteine synthase n=1 Tax=Spartinivicinus marinus TaxID=2994442 RepID=A0A853I112_9GAMM|nr:cysteine synthase family protein [Spartinivicinus marinus]MCX4029508.1 cysteine synthase family protein [Spartinivicinus marinus]NYZ65082.1 cysteine synthase family protein [Spartinivicinus marinus]